MFWRGEQILAKGQQLVKPFSPTQIDCNAYVLRMGDRYFCTSDGAKGIAAAQTKVILTPGQSFAIPSGQFAFLLTKETITVPHNAMAFISMRTPFKFKGLINVSGFHVDPGYEGKLLYAVFNAGPSAISVSEDEKLCKIWFCDLTQLGTDESANSKYRAEPSHGIYDIDNGLIHGMSPPIVSLQGLAEGLSRLENSVNHRFEAQKPTIDGLKTFYDNITTGAAGGLVVAIVLAALATLASLASDVDHWLFPLAQPVQHHVPPSKPVVPTSANKPVAPASTQTGDSRR